MLPSLQHLASNSYDPVTLAAVVKEAVDSDNEESDGGLPRFQAIDDYETDDAGQVSFSAGDILLVVDQDEDGRPCKLPYMHQRSNFFPYTGCLEKKFMKVSELHIYLIHLSYKALQKKTQPLLY